ncbi:P-loop containing nucleoside triphosphate hydrolase protein [Phakopsora pachyrhizi]|nr:P-loop containing nucleoside triphosphate hydrolase protein [Phakopsora pachyrhizi]
MHSQMVMYANDTPPNLPQVPTSSIVLFLIEDEYEKLIVFYFIFKMLICPFYAKLPPNQQEQVCNKTPINTQKFIIGTNVAETSITIPSVNYVIDTGLAKVKCFHSVAGVEELSAEPISPSSAKQCSGCAGREPISLVRFAVVHLSVLGALDKNMKISSIGQQMAKLPLEPPLAQCLLASFENGYATCQYYQYSGSSTGKEEKVYTQRWRPSSITEHPESI